MLSHTLLSSLVDLFPPAFNAAAHVWAMPVAGPIDPPVKPVVYSVSFTGRRRGRLEVTVGQSFALQVAGTLTEACPTPATIEQADDQMMDQVETIGHRIVPDLLQTDRDELDFSPPTVRSLAIQWDWPALAADPQTHLFQAKGQVLAVRLVELD